MEILIYIFVLAAFSAEGLASVCTSVFTDDSRWRHHTSFTQCKFSPTFPSLTNFTIMIITIIFLEKIFSELNRLRGQIFLELKLHVLARRFLLEKGRYSQNKIK